MPDSGAIDSPQCNVYAGAQIDGGSPVSLLDGILDDLRIYSRALSAGEVKNRYSLANQGYGQAYAYNAIGNITSKGGINYSYGTKPHAVTGRSATSYVYDNNGSMTTRGTQTITWDVENRVSTVTGGASFVYDGDSNRVKKVEGGNTVVYVNRYYEKNVTSGEVTTYYYLGRQLGALRKGTTLEYVHQDHLTGTFVSTDSASATKSTVKYLPYGSTRSSTGALGTDRKFTGQRLDTTGLYFYNARYYDAGIGRFVSADTIVPDPHNPQQFNRYTYGLNNPLLYPDPTGHCGLCRSVARYMSGAARGTRDVVVSNAKAVVSLEDISKF